jgi:hypothetical protein
VDADVVEICPLVGLLLIVGLLSVRCGFLPAWFSQFWVLSLRECCLSVIGTLVSHVFLVTPVLYTCQLLMCERFRW